MMTARRVPARALGAPAVSPGAVSLGASLIALGVLAGCSASEPAARLGAPSASPPRAEASRGEATNEAAAEGPDLYGDPLDAALPLTSLDAIVEAPDRFEGRVVRTRGEIARVCQARGCWMELREREGGPAVRVPMAGHSFFLPRDSAGRRATMQGRVVVQALAPEVRAHLESEGAVATASALSIEATGVAID